MSEPVSERSVFDLKVSARKFCKRMKINITERALTRIVLKTRKRMEHEQHRLERMEITTTDGFSFIDYKDPTGESAVQNIMREIMASTPQVA